VKEPEVYDNFQTAVLLGMGDLCLVEYAVKEELARCKAAADSGEHHAALRCRWYESILSSIRTARENGDREYQAAWDLYEVAWKGKEDD